MENEQSTYKQYRYATVAAEALREKDPRTAQSALENLALEMGIKDPEARKKFRDSYSSSDKALQDATNIYTPGYHQGISKEKVSKLFSDYEEYFSKYAGENTKDLLDEFGEETLGDIEKKVMKAAEITESKTDNFSKEDKENAKKTLEKYGLIHTILIKVEQDKTRELYGPLSQSNIKESVQKRYEDQPKEE